MSIYKYYNVEAIKKFFKEESTWLGNMKTCDFIRKIPEVDFKRSLTKELMHMLNKKDILEDSDEKYSHLIFVLLDDTYDRDSYEVLKASYAGLKDVWYHPYILSEMGSYVMNLCIDAADSIYLYFGNLRMASEEASDFFTRLTCDELENLQSQGYKIYTGLSQCTLKRLAFEFMPDDEFDAFYPTFKEHFNNEYNVTGVLLE